MSSLSIDSISLQKQNHDLPAYLDMCHISIETLSAFAGNLAFVWRYQSPVRRIGKSILMRTKRRRLKRV